MTVTTELDADYASQVLRVLRNNPTAQDIDFLVEAYTNVGYLAADAEGLANDAEMARKHAEADAYLEARGRDMTVKDAEMSARFAVKDLLTTEIAATTKARKLRNLLLSLEQAINAVKFLGRVDSPSVR